MAQTEKVVNQKISPLDRARLFAQGTRQHWQELPSIAANAGSVVSFSLPKVRLLSKIRLLIEGTLNLQHATDVLAPGNAFAPFNLIRNIRCESNLGFTFFNLSGRDLFFYNLLKRDNEPVFPATGPQATLPARRQTALGLTGDTAGNGGADNTLRLTLDLPIALNERDPIGLILLQNEETLVTVTIELDAASVLVDNAAGWTAALSNLQVHPMVETYSIPAIREAFPDISILKLVQSKSMVIAAQGQTSLALPVGLTYRKLAFFLENAAGAGIADTAITGDFELVFNQADTPYRIRPSILSGMNQELYGAPLPVGLWVFDFTNQGIPNLSGARDYIDTERMTEFWLRFNAPAAGRVTAIAETMAKLH